MCPNCGYCPTCGRSNGWGVTPFYPHFPITPTPWYVGDFPGYDRYNTTAGNTNVTWRTGTDAQTAVTNTCSDPFHNGA